MRQLTVGYYQMRCGPDPRENRDRATEAILDLARQGARLIVLPELFLTPYFCKSEDARHFALAEYIPGPSTTHFSAVAAETGATLVISLFERRAAGLYHNTLAVITPEEGLLGIYRKMHIPDDPLFYEKFYFTPGDLGFRTFATPHVRLGTLICWDQWFPEAARLTALQGAELLVYPTAIGWLPSEQEARGEVQRSAWETMQRSHAIANGCFVMAVNRVGFEPAPEPSPEPGITFWGSSFVAAPDGRILHRSPEDAEDRALVTLNLEEVEAHRTEWPFLRDRRIDAYEGLTRRFLDA